VETIKVEAEMDATDQLEFPDHHLLAVQHGLQPQLAHLEMLVNPAIESLEADNAMANAGTLEIIPLEQPLTLFVWSKSRVVPVRLNDFSITEKDSHDRYANIEVSYLLQRMESYQGLAILTTNLKSSLDQAFQRRLRFIVTFPFPDAEQREAIWQRIFPTETPTQGLDAKRLAQFNVAGGNIRNIALNAAFIAAEAGKPVRMDHMLEAARLESQKIERPLAESETRGWV
jgi:hypothetical protein